MFSFQLKRNRLYLAPVLPYATWWSIYISLIFPFAEGAHLPEEPGGRDAAAGRGRARTIRSESGRLIFRNHRKRNSAFPEPTEGNFRTFLKKNKFFYCHSGTQKFEIMEGGSVAQWLAYLLLDQAVLGSSLGVSKMFLGKFGFIDVVEIYQQQCTAYCVWTVHEKSCLIVDRTHLVLSSGKLVLQKSLKSWRGAA